MPGITIVDDRTVIVSTSYARAFAVMRDTMLQFGGKILRDDIDRGFLQAKYRYGINITGLRVAAQFRQKDTDNSEVVVSGSFGDAFDTTGAAAKKARDVLSTFVKELSSGIGAESGRTQTTNGAHHSAPIIGTFAVAHRHKSKTTAALLALFLGALGVHRFYLGTWAIGLGYLVLLVIAPGWGLIPAALEAMRFFLISPQTFDARYNYRPVTPFSF